MAFDFYFNGISGKEKGVLVAERPAIPTATKNVEYIKIAGKDETVATDPDENTYDDIIITIKIGFRVNPEEFGKMSRQLKNWLDGDGKLSFSDDPEVFYIVKNVEMTKEERKLKRMGTYEVNFTCSPFSYLKSGAQEYNLSQVTNNEYLMCHPIYKITGEGVCKLSVNGSTVSANVGQYLTIDTDRMLAYRADGTIENTRITGDYENLYLKPGKNQLSATNGFTVKVIPNWRCK